MGQAAIFMPPPIHKSNIVLFPHYLSKNRLKNFAKNINGKYTTDKDGLVTIVNDLLEFHYKVYHRHMELLEISATPAVLIDATRCLEFLRYEAYLLQKPIYCETVDESMLSFIKEQGFRVIEDEERVELYSSFWDDEIRKA